MIKTIMVVDDSASVRQLASMLLPISQYELIEAFDGIDAIYKLNIMKIHLLISDVHMLNMNGTTFVKAVDELPESKRVPIIMLTTGFIKSSRDHAVVDGVKAWLVKPVDKYQLLEMIASYALP